MKAASPPSFLGLGDDAETEGGLAGGFRAVDLDDAALGQAADAEREVHGERARRERLDLHLGVAAQAHDRALAELLGDGGERELDVLVARGGGGTTTAAEALAGAALDMASRNLNFRCPYHARVMKMLEATSRRMVFMRKAEACATPGGQLGR
jgi:hypothetical protein